MIDRREILEAASSFSLLPSIVEKDYILGWMLAGINAHEELSESWIFKGGTCLKKCYFETYRFSEDLDFTLRSVSCQSAFRSPPVPYLRLSGSQRQTTCAWISPTTGACAASSHTLFGRLQREISL